MNNMAPVQYITVEEDRDGQRVDNFLIGRFSGLPRTLIYRWIRKGELRVNKKRIKQTYRVKKDDLLRIPPFHIETVEKPVKVTNEHLQFLEALILFENSDYIILNKPSGIAVHGGSGVSSGLIERMQLLRPNEKKLELAHRLDKETSGCLIIAKKYSVLTYFHKILKAREVKKTYHALVHGKWKVKKGKIDLPLKRHLMPHGERIVRVDLNDGKDSLTYVKKLKDYSDYTLVEACPHTGRTHQIRVHLASKGHPIVCDKKYGLQNKDLLLQNKDLKRLFLHAYRISFVDLKTNENFSFIAPYDHIYEKMLTSLN